MRTVLFVGDNYYGSNSSSLAHGFRRLNCNVWHVDTARFTQPPQYSVRRVVRKARPVDYERLVSRALAARIRQIIESTHIDLVVGFRALAMPGDILASLRVPSVHFHPDDSRNPVNRSANFDDTELLWDVHVTTKSFNVDELRQRGASDVLYLPCAYDDRWHRKPHVRRGSSPIGFIGVARPDRVPLLRRLSHRLGPALHIRGGGWRGVKGLHPGTRVTAGVFGLDMATAMGESPIQLGLLNSDNRDLHTCRTYEIPACGALFVGENTVEHRQIFADGETGFLFDSYDELVGIIDRVKTSRAFVEKTAQAGHRAITEGGNTYVDRAQSILACVA